MHIPDGYLSPATCAAMYAAALPFWAGAARRIRKILASRVFPLVALSSAFVFVVMLFNLPLPGGTTGHATGIAITAIVLGPAASIAAVSIALLIQALLFGDGGVTAFGANCFNMAVIGSLTAWAAYRLVAGRSPAASRRRAFAAGMAGYAAVNAAALFAAIEFGLQPLFFHDAAGTPLYAPYPLRIALPAMMIGHLTIAGAAEFVLTAGVFAYLQRSEPRLLCVASADALQSPRTTRPLFGLLACLLVATPLGLLAGGAAWGEWSARDLTDPAARVAIAASSGAPLPASPPEGLRGLSSFWTAPLRGYAPPFLQSPAVGYLLSAMFGTGIILLATLGARSLATRARQS